MTRPNRTYTVYLAGPITGCNKAQREQWRKEFREAVCRRRRDVEFKDPTEWGDDWKPHKETYALRSVDVVVVNMWKESIGTTVGIVQSHDVGKPIVLIDPNYINSEILRFFVKGNPARTIDEAAERLNEILDSFREIQIQKTTGEVVPFDKAKLMASIQTACGAAHVPEDMFANTVSQLVLDRLQSSTEEGELVPTSRIRDTVLDVLEGISAGVQWHTKAREDAKAVLSAWRTKEEYKESDKQLVELKEENARLQAEAAYYRDLWQAASRSRLASPPQVAASEKPTIRAYPGALADALCAAEEKWSDTLVVLRSAHNSARSHKGWRDYDKAFRLLDLLGMCAYERMTAKATRTYGPTVDQWLEQHQDGFEFARGESKETMERYAKERTFREPGGKEWVCKKHLKIGTHGGAENILRIYFCEDPETHKIVIGHVGEHLPTYTGRP